MLIELRLPGPIDGGSQLENLKSLYQNVNWEDSRQRVEFIHRLLNLFGKWRGTFPNLREIIHTEEIDQLLLDSINYTIDSGERNAFILFAVSNGYKDEPIIGVDGKPLSRRTTAIHRAAMNKCSEFIIRELFKIYSRFDVNYVDEFGFTHLHVVCGYGLDYHVTKFLELGQDPNCIERLTGNSPLHVALTSTAERIEVVRWLLENGADPFLANKDGSTPLHIVCKKKQAYLSILEMFFRICDDKRQKEKFDALDILGRTPLHCACCSGNESAVESLLRRGANPYLADMNGWTPLHIICDNICTYPNLAPIFFKIIDEKQMIVKNKKTTPLKLALRQEHAKIESLLKKSVIVKRNSADGNELTHAQVINKRHRENDLVRTIFEFSVDENLLACINAQNKDGDTPLHLALRRRSNWAAEWLLQNGANPNLADTEGRNSLHAICQPSKKSREEDDDQVDLVKTIFERCHKKYQPLRVDAQDELGRTPLQWAVSSLLPNVVGVLLDNGADLSGFAFPTEAYFATKFDKSMVFKFRSASGALAIVERLESKGYELNLSEALTILKFFHRLGFITEPKLGRIKKIQKDFDKITQETMINSSLSLHKLFNSSKNQTSKSITFKEYYEFARSDKLSTLSKSMRIIEMFVHHLSRIMLKRFIRKWALESFMILTHNRLPLECSEMIIDKSYPFKDLYNICLAAGIISVLLN